MSFPPEVERFFAEERKKQNLIITTHRNLNETRITLENIMDKTNQRGNTLDKREEDSEELMDSSEQFHLVLMPGWKRFIYTFKAPWWWSRCFSCFSCFFCFAKKRREIF